MQRLWHPVAAQRRGVSPLQGDITISVLQLLTCTFLFVCSLQHVPRSKEINSRECMRCHQPTDYINLSGSIRHRAPTVSLYAPSQVSSHSIQL